MTMKVERMTRAYKNVIGMVLLGLALLTAGCGGSTSEPAVPTPEPTARIDLTATTAASAASAETAVNVEPSATTAPSAIPTETPSEGGDGSGNADVLHVRAVQDAGGTWTFHVTVEHPDTGWEDYADGWDVVTPDGTVLKPDPESQFTRTLLHPHENEQPFTRSQSGIEIPEGMTEVRVRAHDLVDGFGGQEVVVDLTVESGPNFEVVRP
jgi:hypothetical protein